MPVKEFKFACCITRVFIICSDSGIGTGVQMATYDSQNACIVCGMMTVSHGQFCTWMSNSRTCIHMVQHLRCMCMDRKASVALLRLTAVCSQIVLPTYASKPVLNSKKASGQGSTVSTHVHGNTFSLCPIRSPWPTESGMMESTCDKQCSL